MARNDVLTDTEREYLEDPGGFDRADSTIRKMNHDLRKKCRNAKRETGLIYEALSGGDIPDPSPGTIPNPERKYGPKADHFYPAAGTENRHTLLTPTERDFILDPEGYAEDHAPSTVSNMKRNLREKYKNWKEEWELLWETHEVWDRVTTSTTTEGECLACGYEEVVEVRSWEATQYWEWMGGWMKTDDADYGPNPFPRGVGSVFSGFCPDCLHIRKDTTEMAIEEGRVPCYRKSCDADTHGIDTDVFRDCWKAGGILLTIDDVEDILGETDHIDERSATRIRTLY